MLLVLAVQEDAISIAMENNGNDHLLYMQIMRQKYRLRENKCGHHFGRNDDQKNSGWGGRIRTLECRYQKPMPYHLATPQFIEITGRTVPEKAKDARYFFKSVQAYHTI